MSPGRIAVMLAALFTSSVALSFVHPWGNPRSRADTAAPLMNGITVPGDVLQVLETKCADCHSENTRWPAYSKLAPLSWFIERDVREGRRHLNMSQWQNYILETRVDLLSRLASEVHSGEMPLPRYLVLHPGARLSSAEQQLIYNWAKSERRRIRQQLAMQQGKSFSN